MGIPKFFRWISERYPLCSQLIQENRIPEFDNLYLDMNGIIHTCSHGNNDDVHFRMSEEQMLLNIFHYIETLFGKIKPKKVFYMAVDGVAPRAKINQQRSRRFRTAHEAAEGVRKALERGETLPEEEAFDSNCITPGTDFMERLSRQLVYFIHKKINEDANWRHCKVILSGQEVPGEGEHKIMEYIRLARSQPDYDPNTRHCLYGLDADLIMLGLVSHDPHFCLLREEVTFGPQKKKSAPSAVIANPDSQRFYLMHLALFREYLDLEFSALRESLPFPYDVERIIDDYILMCVFVGNDFLPHLPGVHINEGALALMFDLYKEALPFMPGYMNDGGKINMDCVEFMIKGLAKKEREQFEEEFEPSTSSSSPSNGGKKRGGGRGKPATANANGGALVLTTRQSEIVEQLKAFVADPYSPDLHFPSDMAPKDVHFIKKITKELGLQTSIVGEKVLRQTIVHRRKRPAAESDSDRNGQEPKEDGDSDSEESSEDEESQLARNRIFRKYAQAQVVPDSSENLQDARRELIDREFAQSRRHYYKEKMSIDSTRPGALDHLVSSYLEGLQWVMHYYYDGVQSWGWFYPYHYAPKIADLLEHLPRIGKNLPPFELGTPFRPFEQLMGVLPVRSKRHIPEAFQELMYDKSSTILDFYPLEFETDLNGKKNDWEAVVKIPFIDEKRLLAAMKTREHRLTPAERLRNTFGSSFIFFYSDENNPISFPSPLPSFPEILHCKTRMEPFHLPILRPEQRLKKGIFPNVRLGASALAGFPSLYTIPNEATLTRHGVKVFVAESKNESIVLSLRNPLSVPSQNMYNADKVADEIVGRRAFVGWPFLTEVVIVAMADGESYWEPATPYAGSVYPRNSANEDDSFGIKKMPLTPEKSSNVVRLSNQIEMQYNSRYGVLLDPIGATTIVYACLLRGMKRLDNGVIVKDFGDVSEQKPFPLATLVLNVEVEDARFQEKPAPPIDEEFPLGTRGFYLGEKVYGCPLEVTGYSKSGRGLHVTVHHLAGTTEEPMFGRVIALNNHTEEKYMPGFTVARLMGVTGTALSKIAASAFVMPSGGGGSRSGETVNIGLGLKFESRKLKVIGYTRRTDQNGWEYSQKAVDLLQEYQQNFPTVFTALARGSQDFVPAEAMFPPELGLDPKASLDALKAWLKKKKVKDFDKVPLEVEFFNRDSIAELERKVAVYLSAEGNPANMASLSLTGIPAHAVLLPNQAPYRLSQTQVFQLGDRVVFVPNVGSIPSGARGTVVGIEKPTMDHTQRKQDQTVQQKDHTWISVVFDEPFLGGSDLEGRCSSRRGLVVSSETLLNLTNQQPPLRRKPVIRLPNTAQLASNSTTQRSAYGGGAQKAILVRPSSATSLGSSQSGGGNKNVWQDRTNKSNLLNTLNQPSANGKQSRKKQAMQQQGGKYAVFAQPNVPSGSQQQQPQGPKPYNVAARPFTAPAPQPQAGATGKYAAFAQPQPVPQQVTAEEVTDQLKAMLRVGGGSGNGSTLPEGNVPKPASSLATEEESASQHLLQLLQRPATASSASPTTSTAASPATQQKKLNLPTAQQLAHMPTSVLRGGRGRGGRGRGRGRGRGGSASTGPAQTS